MLRLLPFAGLVAIISPNTAQGLTLQPPTAQDSKDAQDSLNKVVCKAEETIGTRLGTHKVCATVAEWREQEQANRETLDKMQQTNQSVVPSADPPPR